MRLALCLGLVLFLLFANYSAVVRAVAETPPVISVSGLSTQTIASGSVATISGSVSGGIPLSAANGTFTGYMLFFFYGQTNGTGSLGFDKQFLPAPAGCTTPDLVCNSPAPFTFHHTYDRSGSYDTSLTVYDAAGDYVIATDVVNVIPPRLTVQASAANLTAAEDSAIQFSANVSTFPSSYMVDGFAFQWSFGDNTSAWGEPISHTYTESGNYVAIVRAFDNVTGAVNQTAVTGIVVTNPAPTAGLQIVTTPSLASTYPEDTPIQFSASPSTDVPTDQANLRYFWNFGDGQLGAGFAPSHVYTEPGRFNVTLTVTDESGLSSSASTALTVVNAGLTARTNSTTVAVGNVALLDAGRTTDIPVDVPSENYTWSSSVPQVTDMGSSFGVVGRDGYFAPGSYSPGVTARDSENLTAGASLPVTVTDAAPNVGVFSMYTLANISFYLSGTVGDTYRITVSASGHLLASGQLTRTGTSPKANVLTLTNVPLPLADHDVIALQLVGPPAGSTAANPANLSISFWGDAPCPLHVPKSACATQLFSATLPAAKTPSFVWSINGNQASLGKLVFLSAQVFSPGRTTLSTTWQFGDGSTASSVTPAPAGAQPTVGTVYAQHRWAAGRTYAFNLTTVDGTTAALSNRSTVQVLEGQAASVSDIAPTASLVAPSSEAASTSNSVGFALASENYAATKFNLFWHFGDQLGSSQLGVAKSGSVAHYFRFSATKYAVVVYAADMPGGPATVAWQFLTIQDAPPTASFTGPAGPVAEFSNVTFNASSSVDLAGGAAGRNLSYAWSFGDNTPSVGGSRGGGALASHVFTREGTFRVTLTVTDREGLSGSVTHNVTVADARLLATVANRTAVVDQFARFSLTSLSGAPTDLARLGVVWNWGDGTNSTGLVSGHTYLSVGQFHQTITLSDEDGNPMATLSAYVQVLDQSGSVGLPYGGYVIYGENHSVTFRASVLASAADQAAASGHFSFVWQFGDGSAPVTTTGTLTSGSVSHVYSMAGNPVLSVTVNGPNGSIGSANATLVTVPNWDGDGIPDVYATLILHQPIGNDPAHGVGLTDFLSSFVVHPNSLPSSSTHGDGLTDFQDVFGTVTGYVTNPLDPNVAGDGILNGGHQFVDAFSSPTVVQFNGSGSTQIPGVYHPTFLQPASIRSIRLYVEIVSANLPNLTLTLTDLAGPHAGTPVAIGGIAAPVQNWTLLNSTPVGGPMSNYSFTVPEFQTSSTWQLSVSGGSGTIQTASILIDYYTNPNLADPFGSGLLLGNSLSVPVFNTSEATNANYTVFDGKSFTYSTVDYYPYTETYYKLSVVQGLPYYPWDNGSYTGDNNSAGANLSDPHAFATYYGDREFHIGPWQVHAAGDSALTNGMKAYGRLVYDLTANHYLLSSGAPTFAGSVAPPPYPTDTLGYAGPLNPNAYSTGTSGVADSKAINPVRGPEVFGVTISGGWSTCVLQALSLANPAVGQGVISNLDITNATGAPATLFTGQVSEDDHFYNSGGACYMWHFTFNAHYQLPVDTSKSTNTIRLGIDFSNAASDAYGGSYSFSVPTNPAAGATSLYGEDGSGCANFCISGSVSAFALARMPVVLVNSSGEVHNLPGYGLHWHGDKHFYTLFLTLNDSGAGTPFQHGTNLLLVSGSAFANSTFHTTLAHGNTSAMPFLGNANFTKRTSSSDLTILGSLNATLNSSDAMRLLHALIPLKTPVNGSGNISGGYVALTQTQFELLGLSDQVMQSSPYLPFPTSYYSATSASPPTTFFGEILNVLVSVWNAIVSVVIAIANFLVNLALEIGQAIIGAWNSFVAAVQNAVNAIVQAFDFLITWINEQFAILKQDIQNGMNQLGGLIVAKMVLPMLSLLVNAGAMTQAQFDTIDANLSAKYGIPDPAALDSKDAQDRLSAIFNIVLSVLSAIAVIIGVILYIIGIATVGVGEVTEEAFFATGQLVAFSVQQAVAGGIAAGLAALAGIVGAIFSIATSTSDSVLNNLFGSDVGSLTATAVSSVISMVTGIGFAVSDAILSNTIEGLGGYYIAGGVLAVVGIILAGIATVFAALNESYLAQVVLFSFALACDVIGGVLPFLPQALAIEEASQTVMMGIGITIFAASAALATIGGLVLAIQDLKNYGLG